MNRIFIRLSPLVLLFFCVACASSQENFDPKHDGRWKRIALSLPLAPFTYAWMGLHILTEKRTPDPVNFKRAVRFDPQGFASADLPPEINPTMRKLFEENAPIIVQQAAEGSEDIGEANLIGMPVPSKDSAGKKQVKIDTASPTLFVFVTKAIIKDTPRTQLNYSYPYPEHSQMKAGFDPEAGKIEGITLRITLDSQNQPMFYETVFNCGCYYRVFPAESVETKAREQYGPPATKEKYTLNKEVALKIDFTIPELVPDAPGQRPVVFSVAGRHMPISIDRENRIEGRATIVESKRLTLHPYEELEKGGPDGRGIFRQDNLVAGADRPESWMLYSTGIYHAGTPRRRGTQLIHFDEYDFDDPHLLEKNLHLPDGL